MIDLHRFALSARRTAGLGLLVIALLAPGCAKQTQVYPVSGKIVYGKNKKPATGSMVIFNAVKEDTTEFLRPAGTADEQGIFNVTTRTTNDGAPAGEYVITIFWPGVQKSVLDCDDDDRLKGAFLDVQKSKLRFTVQANTSNQMPVIELP